MNIIELVTNIISRQLHVTCHVNLFISFNVREKVSVAFQESYQFKLERTSTAFKQKGCLYKYQTKFLMPESVGTRSNSNWIQVINTEKT